MSLISIIKFITTHPLNESSKTIALVRFVKWQISTMINPYPIVYPFAVKSKLIIWKGLEGATGNLYCGLDEFEDMAFVLHFLRKEDLFIDIGANIGSYSILAGKEVGAETISIEPVPQTYKTLQLNIALNDIVRNTRLLNIGLGKHKGFLKFTKSLDSENHVATDQETDTIDVQIEKFDDIISLNKPTFIKIDVEGFETEVLNGMQNALTNNNLKGIIIELIGSGKRYGFNEEEIHKKLLSLNFKAFSYSPFDRKLSDSKYFKNISNNFLYLKDIDFIEERIASSIKYRIHGKVF